MEGRSLYETDKVVCINVFINKSYAAPDGVFLFQVLVSLKNQSYRYFGGPVFFDYFWLSEDDIADELKEGIEKYFRIRKGLGLMD